MTTLQKSLNKKAGKVLNVNSDKELSDILRTNLEQANIEVLTVTTGTEALKRVVIEKPDIVILDVSLPDVDGIEVCRQLKDTPATSHIPVLILGSEAPVKSRNGRLLSPADLFITKPFDPKEVVRLVQSYLKKNKRGKNTSPLTGLPNQFQVSDEINCLIQDLKTFVFIYFDIDNFKAFNKVYDYAHGDTALQLLAETVNEAVRRFGNPEDLAGHLGGDNFVIVTSVRKARSLCRRVIADFDRRKKTLYSHEDLVRGYVEYESRFGVKEQFPIMSLKAAVVTNEKQAYLNFVQVMEAAMEQMEYLRRFPGTACYYDLRPGGLEEGTGNLPTIAPRELREEVKTLQGVLAWLTFLTDEIKLPVISVDNAIKEIQGVLKENDIGGQNGISVAKEKIDRLTNMVQILESLVINCPLSKIAPDQVSLKKLLNWIENQVGYLAEKRGMTFEIAAVSESHSILMDGRTLAQALLYLIKGEIEAGSRGDNISIGFSVQNDDYINLQIHSPRYLSPRLISQFLQEHAEAIPFDVLGDKLYPARLLIQGLGGKLNITSEKQEGTTYTIILPPRWQSWMPEVNALLFATDISRKQARAEIKNLSRQLVSMLGGLPVEIENSLNEIRQRVQELGILCNRSLYLAEDFNSRIETQQDRWLQQETEQVGTLEVILTLSNEMSRLLLSRGNFFNTQSAKRVARNSMVIAGDLKLAENDRKALHYASLLKDMGLFLSASDMVDRGVVSTLQEAVSIRERFTMIWKALATMPFFNTALPVMLYKYEHYDGKGGRFGARGSGIPMGSRILAVADAFDTLTSGDLPGEKLSADSAAKRIAGESGTVFDPEIVNAFLMSWKRQELQSVSPQGQA
jgi:diguanylate cyclase (GGDEF)-like protein